MQMLARIKLDKCFGKEINTMTTNSALAPQKESREMVTPDPFRSFQQRLNRMFENAFAPFTFPTGENLSIMTWAPSCDIYETDNEIVVKAELPGVKKEDLKVNVDNNTLVIMGERKFEEETKRENYHRIEQSYGEFQRSFRLPTGIDAKKIAAEFKDGMLRVTLPKAEEAKPKSVEVKVA
jgi:HSP20 family protein